MIDINSFFIMIICILSSILLVVLIILGIKLIGAVSKFDRVAGEFETRLKKIDSLFGIVDTFTDSMALISDKIVDGVVYGIKKIFGKKRKEDDSDE